MLVLLLTITHLKTSTNTKKAWIVSMLIIIIINCNWEENGAAFGGSRWTRERLQRRALNPQISKFTKIYSKIMISIWRGPQIRLTSQLNEHTSCILFKWRKYVSLTVCWPKWVVPPLALVCSHVIPTWNVLQPFDQSLSSLHWDCIRACCSLKFLLSIVL